MSVAEVAAELRRVLRLLSVDQVAIARAYLDEARSRLAEATKGTNRAEASQAHRTLDDAIVRLDQLQSTVVAAQEAVKAYISQLVGSSVAAAVGEPVYSGPPAGADTRAKAILAKLPMRAVGDKTSGYWIDEDGAEHGPLVSGEDEDYQQALEDLRTLQVGPQHGAMWAVPTSRSSSLHASDGASAPGWH